VTRVVVLDSMVVDTLLDDPAAFALAVSATADGRLRMLSTHVTADEVAKLQHNPERRAGLLRVLDELTQQVPTAGFILDVSRLDEAMLNDDVETLEVLRSRNPGKHSEDALIAATAQFHGAALASDERTSACRPRPRVRDRGVDQRRIARRAAGPPRGRRWQHGRVAASSQDRRSAVPTRFVRRESQGLLSGCTAVHVDAKP